MMWRVSANALPEFLLVVLVIPRSLVIGVLTCEGKPTFTSHIVHGSGDGICWLFLEQHGATECCEFCERTWDTHAAQLLLPGQLEPFENIAVRDIRCCCYESGDIVDGGDGTQYYF